MRVKTIFISDIHLATKGCKVEYLLKFLEEYEADVYYLIGDIIDGWRIRSKWFWPEEHSTVIKKFLELSNSGKKIYWITGNHDEFLRPFVEFHLTLGSIEILNETTFISVSGKRYWITHGDKFDLIMCNIKWLSYIGDYSYVFLIWLNNHLNRFRKSLGLRYWSLSNYLKQSTKQVVRFVSDYSTIVSTECKNKGYNGVICGHIHTAEEKWIDGIHYINTGDWVESCTAAIEKYSGELEIVKYIEITHKE